MTKNLGEDGRKHSKDMDMIFVALFSLRSQASCAERTQCDGRVEPNPGAVFPPTPTPRQRSNDPTKREVGRWPPVKDKIQTELFRSNPNSEFLKNMRVLQRGVGGKR
jgi:hypothetical protein